MTDEHSIVLEPEVDSIQGTPKAEIQAQPVLHPLLIAAMEAGSIQVESLERMQEIQFRHEENEARKAYAKAKVALMADLPATLDHDRVVKYSNVCYSYTTMKKAVEAVQPKLSKFGFAYQWIPDVLQNGHIQITFRVTHVMGHSEDFTLSGPPDTAGKKDPLKAIGSTTSYLKRYTFCLGFGITTGDMKDADDHSSDDQYSKIDPVRTNKAVAFFESAGLPLQEAEEHLGKPSGEWTVGDLQALKTFVRETGWHPQRTPKELQDDIAIASHKLWGIDWPVKAKELFERQNTTLSGASYESLQSVLTEIKDMQAAIEEEKNGQ